MKTLLITLSYMLLVTWVYSTEIPLDSEIKSVKVYQQGAEITRVLTTQLSSGVNTIVLTNLSSTVNPSSIQAKLTKGATLMSASYQYNYLGGSKFNQKVKALKDSIEIVDIALQSTQAGIHGLTEEESFIKSNKVISGKDAPLNLADLKAISTYARTRINEIRIALIADRKQERKQQQRLVKLNQQLNEWNAKYKKPSGEIRMDVLSDKSQSASFEVTYIVNSASWYASYDLRSESIEDPITLVYKAEVTQSTGVDWNEVPLTISTGNPSVNQSRPILNPWYIDFIIHYGGYGYDKNTRQKALQNIATYDEVQITDGNAPAMDHGGVQDYTTLQLNQLNEEFQIALEYDIPSDNKKHTVIMKDFELAAKYQYHAVPKLDRDAFLLAKVTQWEDISLLPGNANIFFENSFVGTSYINPNMTSDTLLLSLGRDRRIIVEREKVQDYTSKKLIGGSKKETFGYKFTVRNTKNQPINIEVLDHIPISKNKEIEVKLEEYEGAKYTEEVGKLEWTFTLPPNTSKEMKLIYYVKYPKDKQIPGL